MSFFALEKIRHNGESFSPGDEISGLSTEEAERLIKLKVAEKRTGDESDSDSTGPSRDLILSIEQFAELKADEQKDRLKGFGIDPAGKVEERIDQYEAWYNEQVAGSLNA